MRVAVIGAGASGLTSAKYAKEKGFECVVYEQCSDIGGVWIYTDNTEFDEHGYPVHSAMYQGLKTNLPKEIMGFSDFQIPERPRSYLTQKEILEFLNLYANNFNLKPLINFNRVVSSVKPMENGTWEIQTECKIDKQKFIELFDAVMVCTGHYSTPNVPNISGMESFQGEQIHSKFYRKKENYEKKRILVVGAGPSGIDLALQLSDVAEKVFFSHSNESLQSEYPKSVIMKPLVKYIKENEIIFGDDTFVKVDVIIYCTGYLYKFPFLDKLCGITIEENHIQPLYKHVININKPTMAIIGMPFNVCTFQMFDLQARFFIHSLTGEMKLPPAEEMLKDSALEMKERISRGFRKCLAHYMGPYQRTYYSDLAQLANTKDIPQVMIDIKASSNARFSEDVLHFRDDLYEIVDDENYIHMVE